MNKNIKRILATPPRNIRILGGVFCVFLALGNIATILLFLSTDLVEKNQIFLIKGIILLIITPFLFAFIAPPCILGYYPVLLVKLLSEKIIKSFIKDMNKIYSIDQLNRKNKSSIINSFFILLFLVALISILSVLSY